MLLFRLLTVTLTSIYWMKLSAHVFLPSFILNLMLTHLMAGWCRDSSQSVLEAIQIGCVMNNNQSMLFQWTVISVGGFLVLFPILEISTMMRLMVAVTLIEVTVTVTVKSVSRTMIIPRRKKKSFLLWQQKNQTSQFYPVLTRMIVLVMNVLIQAVIGLLREGAFQVWSQ